MSMLSTDTKAIFLQPQSEQDKKVPCIPCSCSPCTPSSLIFDVNVLINCVCRLQCPLTDASPVVSETCPHCSVCGRRGTRCGIYVYL